MLQRQHAENAGQVAQNEGENDAIGGESFKGPLICGHGRADPFSFLFEKLAVGGELLLNFSLEFSEALKAVPYPTSVRGFLARFNGSLMCEDEVANPIGFCANDLLQSRRHG